MEEAGTVGRTEVRSSQGVGTDTRVWEAWKLEVGSGCQ